MALAHLALRAAARLASTAAIVLIVRMVHLALRGIALPMVPRVLQAAVRMVTIAVTVLIARMARRALQENVHMASICPALPVVPVMLGIAPCALPVQWGRPVRWATVRNAVRLTAPAR